MKISFITRNGEIKIGHLIYSYLAFEGDMRYVIRVDRDRDYRCTKDSDGIYKELVIWLNLHDIIQNSRKRK